MKKNKKLKMLVTGGAGFIGSHLVDSLIADGFDVVVIDNLTTGKRSQVNSKAKFVKADIRDFKIIKPYFRGVDRVFHLAGRARIQPSIQDPIPTFESNVMGTLNVLLASRDMGVKRVVYSASSSSYGDQESFPLHEEMRPKFKSPYSLSKYIGEELCSVFNKLYGLETVSLRYFNVYGPRQLTGGAYATVIGIFLQQFKKGKPLTIVGDGKIERDFTYVFDVVQANLLAARSSKVGKGEVINIGPGKSYSINKVASMILAGGNEKIKTRNILTVPGLKPILVNSKLSKIKVAPGFLYIPARPGEVRRSIADNKRAKTLINWRPDTSLEEGISKLILGL